MRGTVAKANVTAIIQKAFGSDFVGTQDGKLYVWADDGGNKVQISIAMTCPKTGIAVEPAAPAKEDWDFSD